MYLSEIKIEGYRIFNKTAIISLNKGLNLFVGENGCGKSSVIDAIRLLLNEDEYSRNGINDEEFYSSIDKKVRAEKISIKGKFADLSEEKKIEYLTWLDEEYNAILNIDIIRKQDKRNNFRRTIWGGSSSNSFFEWEPLNDIQCVYLPALRDAEKKLRANRGSRLARLLMNLAQDEMKEKRKNGQLMEIENDVNEFNKELAKKKNIARANELINSSLERALGSVFGQSTKIQFNDLTYERIVEALRLVFFPSISANEEVVYRNLFENSLGYNNLIYLATILAEFEGLKENYTSPRILLIEELEAHLHPQVQIKVLKYLEEQALNNDIQIIITTHSTTIAAATPLKNIISLNIMKDGSIKPTALKACKLEEKAERFINRWLDATKSTLLFSKGIILVEGLAEAMLIPKMAEIYLKEFKEKNMNYAIPLSLEEAGISVINMNGIYFQYFMQLYNGYKLILPQRENAESKNKYNKRLSEFIKKDQYVQAEFESTDCIPIRCVALTDNDPPKCDKPIQGEEIEGNNPQLYLINQLRNMTNNCKVFKNFKTLEYDMALDAENAKFMIEVILENLETDGSIKEKLENYLDLIKHEEEFENSEIAFEILMQIDSNYIGKGLFAQLLLEKIDEKNKFMVPQYIKDAIKFILDLQEIVDGKK
ncbi:MAG: AAA family ATPase [Clostridium beijerinckii]|jgi:predicted ATP-dependent endonuclease of OLD family|nr:AAA family ATPase [Clostridium beijerinckii]MCI1583791.1 AAA family ATPase [Clostridium beijerinckii]MCI1623855.1 AAA family ATPase [Clostridium beijerinckii]